MMSATGEFNENRQESEDSSFPPRKRSTPHSPTKSTFFAKEGSYKFVKTDSEVELSYVREFAVKNAEDNSEVSDVLLYTEDMLYVAIQGEPNETLKKFSLHGQQHIVQKNLEVKTMALLKGRKPSLAFRTGGSVTIKNGDQQEPPIKKDFQKGTVQAIAGIDSTSFAVVQYKKVVLLTADGHYTREFDRKCGNWLLNYWTWCHTVVDACSLRNDVLLIFDKCGIHQISPHSGKDQLIKVPKMKDVSSVAAFDEESLFACDQNKLYFFRLDKKKVVNKWCCQQMLRDGDRLEHISVMRSTCVVSTKYGFVLVFTISVKRP